MNEQFQCTEGVILRKLAYREYDQIVTVFTPDQGIMKLFHKGSKRKKQLQGICTALNRVEITYREKNSELFACEHVGLIQSYLAIRECLNRLEAACDLIQALLSSQLVGRAALPLYQLLIFYLDKFSVIEDPWILALSFRLKILRYEGVFSLSALSESHLFTAQELPLIELLTLSQSYTQLAQAILPKEFASKVCVLFNEQMQR